MLFWNIRALDKLFYFIIFSLLICFNVTWKMHRVTFFCHLIFTLYMHIVCSLIHLILTDPTGLMIWVTLWGMWRCCLHLVLHVWPLGLQMSAEMAIRPELLLIAQAAHASAVLHNPKGLRLQATSSMTAWGSENSYELWPPNFLCCTPGTNRSAVSLFNYVATCM